MENNNDSQGSSLEQNIWFLLYRTGLRMKLELQRLFQDAGYPITTNHWAVLHVIYEQGDLSQIELARALHKNKANVTRILDVIEKQGFIVRKIDISDRRKYLISLTGEAKAAMEKLVPIAASFKKKCLEGQTDMDLKRMVATLDLIFGNLD